MSAANSKNTFKRNMRTMYSPGGLPNSVVFQGGWINFGYWKGIDFEVPDVQDRIKASMSLYDQLFYRLDLTSRVNALEAGCGQGLGCMRLLRKYSPESVTGIDLSRDQINVAKRLPVSKDESARLQFAVAEAENLPYEDNVFSHVYSVEAVQHFGSFRAFAREARRVLVPGGELGITTMFASDEAAIARLALMLPTVKHGLDRIAAAPAVKDMLNEAGFDNIICESIGAHVFPSFDRWIELKLGADRWGRNWLRSYRDGLLDYLIIRAQRI